MPVDGAPPAILVVGAAHGERDALLRLVLALPWPLPIPVVAALQGASGHDVEHLVRASARPITVSWDKEPIGTRAVHLAPAGYHLLIERDSLALSADAPEHGARPALAPLFESASWSFRSEARGVLLGYAGPDGEAAAAALPGVRRLDPGERTTLAYLLAGMEGP